jgi:hypothetical protein
MKQYIVLASMIILGLAIYSFVCGNGEDSVKSAVSELLQNEASELSYSARSLI